MKEDGIRVWRTDNRVALEVLTGRPWWRFWSKRRLVIWFNRAEATRLKNLIGAALS